MRSNVLGWMPEASNVTAGTPLASEPTVARPPPCEWPVIARLLDCAPALPNTRWNSTAVLTAVPLNLSTGSVGKPVPWRKLFSQSAAPSAVPRYDST